MGGLLIAFATTEGQSQKVAEYAAEIAKSVGRTPDLVCLETADPKAPVAPFDQAVLVGSVHVGRHQPELVSFIKAHRDALSAAPTALLSLSLSASSDDPRDVEDAKRCIKNLEEETGWTATEEVPVAGAVHLNEYGFFKRLLMKRILKENDVEVGDRTDIEFTDWAALRDFLIKFYAARPAA